MEDRMSSAAPVNPVSPRIQYSAYLSQAASYGYTVVAGTASVIAETGLWLAKGSGVKNLIARPMDLMPHWAFKLGFEIPASLARVCADMSRFKVVIGALEAFTKIQTDVIAAPKEERHYLVIKENDYSVATTIYSIEEQMIKKVGQIASWTMSSMEFIMYCRNSTLLSLGTKGLTRVSWIATAAGTVASVQGLYAEGKFLYKNWSPQPQIMLYRKANNKIVTVPNDLSVVTLSKVEIASSMIKIALHVSCLALAICFATALFGYTFEALRTAKLVALTSMTLFTIANHFWDRLVIGDYRVSILPFPEAVPPLPK
jgi:hypothetical protein